MSARAPPLAVPAAPRWPPWRTPALALVLVLGTAWLAHEVPWTWRPPREALPPIRAWVTAFFAWLGNDAGLSPLTVRDLTRGLSWLLSFPLA